MSSSMFARISGPQPIAKGIIHISTTYTFYINIIYCI